jgi:predicted NBD/HSP70 family sugar kinase
LNRKPLRSYDIRERNEKLVLSLISSRKTLSQSEVVAITGLKAPTVFRIFSILEAKQYIEPCDSGIEIPEKKGRKPVYYCIKSDAHYAIGLDFWNRSASVVIVDFHRQPIYENIVNFPADVDAAYVLNRLRTLIRTSLRTSGIPPEKLLGIGIGSPGVIDLKQGMVLFYPRIRGMVNFPIREKLERSFNVPVHLHNNSAVIALSEYRYGKAKKCSSLLLLLLRAGLGGSFIQAGELFVSQEQTALEIGHMKIGSGEKPCWCGERGCLETELSEDRLVAELDAVSPARDLSNLNDALIAGNAGVKKVLEEKGELLSCAIRNLYMLFRPQAFLIVTRSEALSEFLAEQARQTLRHLKVADQRVKVSVLADQYNPIIAGRGATDLVFDHFLQSRRTS